METRLPLRFAVRRLPVEIETTAYDGGDNNLTILSIDPTRGFYLRSGFDYEEGRNTIAVVDNWRERGRPGQPEFRLLENELAVDAEALRRSCLYDHVARFIDFAALSDEPMTVDAVDLALAELNPITRRSPAV